MEKTDERESSAPPPAEFRAESPEDQTNGSSNSTASPDALRREAYSNPMRQLESELNLTQGYLEIRERGNAPAPRPEVPPAPPRREEPVPQEPIPQNPPQDRRPEPIPVPVPVPVPVPEYEDRNCPSNSPNCVPDYDSRTIPRTQYGPYRPSPEPTTYHQQQWWQRSQQPPVRDPLDWRSYVPSPGPKNSHQQQWWQQHQRPGTPGPYSDPNRYPDQYNDRDRYNNPNNNPNNYPRRPYDDRTEYQDPRDPRNYPDNRRQIPDNRQQIPDIILRQLPNVIQRQIPDNRRQDQQDPRQQDWQRQQEWQRQQDWQRQQESTQRQQELQRQQDWQRQQIENQRRNQYTERADRPDMQERTGLDPRLEQSINSFLGKKVSSYDRSVPDKLGCARAVSLVLERAYGYSSKAQGTDNLQDAIVKQGWSKVDSRSIQPGDVIIGLRQNRPGHAAIYMGNNKIFNNDSNALQMQVSSLDKFRSDEFVQVMVFRKRR